MPTITQSRRRRAKKTRLQMRKSEDGKKAELFLYDAIDAGIWGGISAKGVARALKEMGDVDELVIRINSPGGFVFEATAIYNLLKNHKAKKIVFVDGLAASAASFIMLVGDSITVPKNAYVMIHNAWSLAIGDKRAMNKEGGLLGKIDDTIAEMYADRGSKSKEEFAALMDEETWLTGTEAKAVGLADTVGDASQAKNRFDLSQFGYRNVPADLLSALPGSANQSRANLFAQTIAAFGARNILPGENPMSAMLPNNGPATPPANTVPATPPANQPDNPQPATPPADATPASAPVDVAAAEKAAADKATKRATDIMDLCQMAGCPEKASAFISNATVTVESVQAQLFKDLCASNAAVGADAAGNPAGGAPPKDDENSKFKEEYKAQAAAFKAAGLSEEDYIFSRRCDEGLDSPALK